MANTLYVVILRSRITGRELRGTAFGMNKEQAIAKVQNDHECSYPPWLVLRRKGDHMVRDWKATDYKRAEYLDKDQLSLF